jgi:hypothetical protein
MILPGIPEVIPGAIRAPIGVWYTQTEPTSSPVYESQRISRILPIGRFYSTPKDGRVFEIREGTAPNGEGGLRSAAVSRLTGF